MPTIFRFYLVNSLTFGSNILIYLLLSLIFESERSIQEENYISVLSHILTVPVSFYLNYHFVFLRTLENRYTLFKKFFISSLLFIFLFKIIHQILIYSNLWSFFTYITATVVVSLLNYCILNYWVFRRIEVPENMEGCKVRLILHADDFGVCSEVTHDIMDCIEKKTIYRTSVICNTNDINEIAERLKGWPADFEMGLHLNLVEGKPISAADQVDKLICDSSGEFKRSFLNLWKVYLFSNAKSRRELKAQITSEVESQIIAFDRLFKRVDKPLHIDGHMHIHVLPFVLDIIISLSKKYNIRSIRLPNERFYICRQNLKSYFSINMIKFIVLKVLSKLQVDKIKRSGLKYNDYIIGILSTGQMNKSSLVSALQALDGMDKNTVVEILFHPGGVQDKRSVDWTTSTQFINYYSNTQRGKEKKFIISDNFSQIIDQYPIINKL